MKEPKHVVALFTLFCYNFYYLKFIVKIRFSDAVGRVSIVSVYGSTEGRMCTYFYGDIPVSDRGISTINYHSVTCFNELIYPVLHLLSKGKQNRKSPRPCCSHDRVL